VHEAQTLTYLRLKGCAVGLLMNFNDTMLKKWPAARRALTFRAKRIKRPSLRPLRSLRLCVTAEPRATTKLPTIFDRRRATRPELLPEVSHPPIAGEIGAIETTRQQGNATPSRQVLHGFAEVAPRHPSIPWRLGALAIRSGAPPWIVTRPPARSSTTMVPGPQPRPAAPPRPTAAKI
jgi:hypothetical protein